MSNRPKRHLCRSVSLTLLLLLLLPCSAPTLAAAQVVLVVDCPAPPAGAALPALEAHLDCLDTQVEQRRAVWAALNAGYRELHGLYRHSRREGAMPAGLEQEYLRRRDAAQAARFALRDAIVAHRSARDRIGAWIRARQRLRLYAGYDGTLWTRLAAGPVPGTSSAVDSARYRQPSGVIGFAYEVPIRRAFAMRVGARLGVGVARMGFGFLEVERDDLPTDTDTFGAAYSVMIDGAFTKRVGRLMAIGANIQLRVQRTPSRTARFDGHRLRFRDLVFAGLVVGASVELDLGMQSGLRIEFTPGLGPSLNRAPRSVVVRMATALSYGF